MIADLVLLLLAGAVTTLIVASGAWIVSAVVGLILALAATQERSRIAARFSMLIVVIVRSLPPLLVLFITFFGLGQYGVRLPPVLAAIVALGITESGVSAEYYRAGFLTVPTEQREAGRSLGMSPLQVMRYVVVPQTFAFIVPPLLNVFIGLLKLATLAAAVGAPEILYRAQYFMNSYGQVVLVAAVVVVLYVIATIPLSRGVARLEGWLRAQV